MRVESRTVGGQFLSHIKALIPNPSMPTKFCFVGVGFYGLDLTLTQPLVILSLSWVDMNMAFHKQPRPGEAV